MDPQHPAPQQNPYDFILNQGAPAPKRGLFSMPSGSSPRKKIILIITGVIVLVFLLLIMVAILGGGGNKSLLTVAQEQTEIIRVASLAQNEKAARSGDTLILANNVALTVSSTQLKVTPMLPKGSEKQLGFKQNPKTDAALASAAQNNTYDKVFAETIQLQLKQYRNSLKEAYNSSKKPENKRVFQSAYEGVGVLLGDSEPATTN